MPPRFLVAFIVVFWVGTIAYLIYEEYWPWWRTDAPPAFIVEMADEASPLVTQWSIYRGDKKVGSISTTMTCLKDDTIELESTIEDLMFEVPAVLVPVTVHFHITKLRTVQRVRRDGQLVRVRSKLNLAIGAFGKDKDLKITAIIQGNVVDGHLHARSTLHSDFGRTEQDLEPIPIQMGSAFNPMQPIAKLRVRPGQHWKMSSVDPLGEAIQASFRHFVQQVAAMGGTSIKLKVDTPKLILAEVASEPRQWSYDGKSAKCYVIEYRTDDRNLTGSTWVSVDDGKVMRQEISSFGDKLVLEREF